MADAGIGEAMLLSAAMGGGSAAITGGDPLKGALLGGLTGGLGAGIGGMLSGAMPGAVLEGAAGAGGAGAGAGVGFGAGSANVGGSLGGNLAQFPSSFVPSETGITGLSGSSLLNPALNPNTALTIPTGFDTLPPAAAPATSVASAAPMPNVAYNPANVTSLGSEFGTQATFDAANAAPNVASTAGPSSFQKAISDPMKYINDHRFMMGSAALAGATGARYKPNFPGEDPNNPLKKFRYDPSTYMPSRPYAEGGIASLGSGNMVVGGNPLTDSNENNSFEASSFPVSYMASGGISDLGSYSDGGRMLEGPGDGMSDSIPANIGGKRPARLAQGEFVVPADVVSHLGNGSTDAGAKQLYHMMDKVRQARTGRKSQGREINPGKYMPA